MERLTKYEPCEGGIPLVTVEDEQSALQRLAAYEDAEEQGLLVRLPCWIPVTERLPEMYQPVLTFDGKLHTVEMRVPYILDGDGEQIESDWWVEADNDIDAEYYRGLRDGAATHWMPLPEPPKEG